jgi:hypothetical protein
MGPDDEDIEEAEVVPADADEDEVDEADEYGVSTFK